MTSRLALVFCFMLAILVGGATACSRSGGPSRTYPVGWVDQQRLTEADREPENWFTGGRDQNFSYYSPLTDIGPTNVGTLGFAWQYRLDTMRGQEATPIVVDGRMFIAGNWGRVYVLDAATGKQIWTFDPNVDGQIMRNACCDAVNRGLALWRGMVFVAALDGRLFALDAGTGKVKWVADTIVKNGFPYSVTGAPYIAGDVVVIGNGGADFGSRGYVSAYNTKTGKLAWRFWVVPHDPALGPQESPALERAVATWDPRSDWKSGGGGNAWDGMAYDPASNLVFIGTGNGAPWDWRHRSPGGGDHLYLSSIVALDAATGELKWHYQTTPGENWDYTAVQKLVLADLTIDGRVRKVVMQAPKNGFLYVLDRATGKPISVNPIVFQNWARGIDGVTGRPLPSPAGDYDRAARLVYPWTGGAHNWQPMSFSPRTGLVYIPAMQHGQILVNTRARPAGEVQGWSFSGGGLDPGSYDPAALARRPDARRRRRGGQARAEGAADRLGSGAATRGLDQRRRSRGVERRHHDHRLRSRRARHHGRRVERLRRADRTTAQEHHDRLHDHGGGDDV